MNGRIEMMHQEKRTPVTLEVYEAPVVVARNTYRLRLHKPDGFTFVPGQSMKFNFQNETKVDGSWRTPSFTIVSAPHQPYLEFVFRVRADENDWSPTKQTLMKLQVGESVPMLGVLNDQSDEVMYPQEGEKGVPIVMLAGGVGVAPFISMMRHAEHVGDRRDFHLLYANPTYDDVVYEDEIERYRHSLAPNLWLQNFLTREKREGFNEGYFNPELIQSIRARAPRNKEPIFFVSGSEGMVAATVAMLQALHIPDSRIRVKKYTGYTGVDDTIRE